ncbi:hypothetical protein ABPG77_005049 [Micractinium sp. CCAP 211/92]
MPKTALRRSAAAKPPLPPSSPPPSQQQHSVVPQSSHNQPGTAQQAVRGGKWDPLSWLPRSFGTWQGKLLYGGSILYRATSAQRAGDNHVLGFAGARSQPHSSC